jgi:His/Glu/Gln/Arg/opine family amino acid ABC transporter permease subunit
VIEFPQAYFALYLQGAAIGIGLTVAAMIGSVVIGLLGALARISDKPLPRAIGTVYVAIFRGVPPLVLLYIIYFGLPAWAQQMKFESLVQLLAPLNNRLFAATLAFAINSGAYSTEILRASINSVGTDQFEAARSLGMSRTTSLRRIILPQALRIAFPPLGNEFIIVLKGTSLASVIGVTELMRNAQQAAAATFENLTAYSFAAVFYIALVVLVQVAVGSLERFLGLGTKTDDSALDRAS